MKKLIRCVMAGVMFGMMAAVVVPAVTDTASTAEAATTWYRCSKCGRTTANPGSSNPHCPKGGSHAWYATR